MLITTADIKSYLDIGHTDDDPRLDKIAAQVSRDIARYTRRSFDGVVANEEYLDGGGVALIVSRLPLVSVTQIADDTSGTDVDLDAIRVKGAAGLIHKRASGVNVPWPGCDGDGRYTVSYTHGYASPPEDVTGIALQLAAALYERPDLSEKSRSEGDFSASYGPVWNEDALHVLKPYRNIIIG